MKKVLSNFFVFTILFLVSYCSSSEKTEENKLDIVYTNENVSGETLGNEDAKTSSDTFDNHADTKDQKETMMFHCTKDEECEQLFAPIPVCRFAKCHKESGKCFLFDKDDGTPCDDGLSCTLGDRCLNGECVPLEENCGCITDADCAEYDDDNLCNGVAKCNEEHKCVIPEETVVKCEPTGNPCEINECNPHTGKCEIKEIPEGGECDDGDPCTAKSVCKNKECVMVEPTICDDHNDCTMDVCKSDEGGCVFIPLDSGPCDDGNQCTETGSCKEGKCVAPFTLKGIACDDGDPCTVNDVCDGKGNCVGGENICDKEHDCTDNIDDDNDGMTDCVDPDCYYDENCDFIACIPKWKLKCGETHQWELDALDTTDQVDKYSCSLYSYPDNEYTYQYLSLCDEKNVVVVLTRISGNSPLDLFLLDGDYACNGYKCIKYAKMEGNQATLVFDAKKDKTYFFTIDARGGGAKGVKFKIKLQCTCGVEIE